MLLPRWDLRPTRGDTVPAALRGSGPARQEQDAGALARDDTGCLPRPCGSQPADQPPRGGTGPGRESSPDACRSVSSSNGARRRSAPGTRPAGTAGAGTAGAAAGTAARATAAASSAVTGAAARTPARTPGATAGTPATAAAAAAAGTGTRARASASTASRAAPRTTADGTRRRRSGIRLPIRPGHPVSGQLLAGWAWSWVWACRRCSASALT